MTRDEGFCTVGEVARLAHVTVRTLHHYHRLGLVTPSARSGAGYRLYSVADLERLQTALFYRELGFPLEEIRGLASTAGLIVAGSMLQKRQQPDIATYIGSGKVEELIQELAEDYTIAIVTHNMQQAARVSDKTAFMYLGELIEFGETDRIFTSPSDRRTQDYITGRFG